MENLRHGSRKILNIKDGDSLEFFKGDEGIVIRRYVPSLKG